MTTAWPGYSCWRTSSSRPRPRWRWLDHVETMLGAADPNAPRIRRTGHDRHHRDAARAGRRRQHQLRGFPVMSTAPHVVVSEVTRIHGTGETAVTALAGVSLEIHPGGARRRHGPERVGQVDPAQRRRWPRPPHERHGSIGGDTLTDLGPATWRSSAAGGWGSSSRTTTSSRASPRPRTSPCRSSSTAPARARPAAARHTLDLMGLMDLPTATPTRCPAASSSASPSPGR